MYPSNVAPFLGGEVNSTTLPNSLYETNEDGYAACLPASSVDGICKDPSINKIKFADIFASGLDLAIKEKISSLVGLTKLNALSLALNRGEMSFIAFTSPK